MRLCSFHSNKCYLRLPQFLLGICGGPGEGSGAPALAGARRRPEGAAGGVQPVGSFGQGSYSVSEMSLCCIINGTVFCSIDAHLEFCGASLENDL